MKVNITIGKYKEMLVINGFKQQEGADYFDIYSHISRITCIRTLTVITIINKLEIHQINVKITFFNDDLDEEVYMEQLKEFIVNGQENFFVSLSNHYMIWSKHLNNGMRKLNKVILLNEFKINKVDKFTCVNVMSFYVSICMIYFFYNNDHMVKSTKKNVN